MVTLGGGSSSTVPRLHVELAIDEPMQVSEPGAKKRRYEDAEDLGLQSSPKRSRPTEEEEEPIGMIL